MNLEQNNNLTPLRTANKTPSVCKDISLEILSRDTGLGALQRVFKADNRKRIRKLDLKRCRNFSDEQMLKFSSILKGNLASVKNLRISLLESTELTDAGVRTFGKIFHGGIPGLTHLAIQVAGANISNTGALEVNNAIKNGYYDVTHLKIDFTGCKNVGHESIHKFCHTIKSRFVKLTHLGLHFSECSVGDATMKSFADTLKSTLKHLQGLEIQLIGCRDITDAGLTALSEAFNHHANQQKPLRSLKIDLTECRGISNDGLGKICESLVTGYQKLEELVIETIDCQNVNDEGVRIVSTALEAGSFGVLKNLNLNFIGCENVTKEGMKTLSTVVLGRYQHLQEYEIFDGSGTLYKNQFVIQE